MFNNGACKGMSTFAAQDLLVLSPKPQSLDQKTKNPKAQTAFLCPGPKPSKTHEKKLPGGSVQSTGLERASSPQMAISQPVLNASEQQ